MFRTRLLVVLVTAFLLVPVLPVGGSGAAVLAAPRGPVLRTDGATLDAAVRCTGGVATSERRPVLLVHGTGAVPRENFAWNYDVKLRERGIPFCTVTVPERGMRDLQVNVEYVVHAIRVMARRSGQRIGVIGHSQGAFLTSYALRMWPDLAAKVEDFISYAGTFTYGTDLASSLCTLPCATAFQQFSPGSRLLTAMADHPLPAGPSYTAFATAADEIVVPQPRASTLRAPGARNYHLQDLCPADTAEHLTIIAERPFFQLAFDALRHDGPGRLERLSTLRCGFDQEVVRAAPSAATFGVGTAAAYSRNLATAEPALRGYWAAGS